MSNNFFMGFSVTMKSFLHHNPWFDWEFVVLDDHLSPRIKSEMKKIYSNLIFRKPNYEAYSRINFNRTIDSLKTTFYKLDAFSLYDYDRVVQLDMDMVCQGDMREVFEQTEPFSACLTYRLQADVLGADFNSGFFVVNKKFLNQTTYEKLLSIASVGYAMPDQKTLNTFFNRKFNILDKKYNCEKRMIKSKNNYMKPEDMIIIHYVGKKPWHEEEDLPEHEKGYDAVNDIWWGWYNK